MNEQTLQLMTWLIPGVPLLAFFVIALVAHRNRTLSWVIAWIAIMSSLVMSWTVAINVLSRGLHALEEHPVQISSMIDWIPLGNFFQGEWLRIGVVVDPLTAIMLLMVSTATTMIFIYSVGYHNWGHGLGKHKGEPQHDMTEEPLLARFFGYMCLFAGSMLLLVVADNLLLLFVGWELMGFCSYSLIGFWYARQYPDPADMPIPRIPPRNAAVKAFMTTRIADVVMLLGIVFMWATFGTMNFREAFTVVPSRPNCSTIVGKRCVPRRCPVERRKFSLLGVCATVQSDLSKRTCFGAPFKGSTVKNAGHLRNS